MKEEAALDKKNNPYAQLLEKHISYKVDENNKVVDLKQTEITHSYYHMDLEEEQERESFNEGLKYKKGRQALLDGKVKSTIHGNNYGGPITNLYPLQRFNGQPIRRDDSQNEQNQPLSFLKQKSINLVETT